MIRRLRLWATRPYKFDRLKSILSRPGICVLDVGCGNHSATVTKAHFPACRYFGIDMVWYNNDDRDRQAMEKYYEMNIDDTHQLDELPDGFFDCIIMNHIIEHTQNGLGILTKLSHKLKRGGQLYVETPSERTLSFPSMKGTLNFRDDPTHVRVYTLHEMNNTLVESGLRILRSGIRRSWRKIMLMPIYAVASLFTYGHLRAVVVWDLLGFAHFSLGIKE